MPTSRSVPVEISCPNCHKAVHLDAWMLIDVDERPDLIRGIQNNRLNPAICSSCGTRGFADLPVLLYFPGESAPLLFSPATTTPETVNRQDAATSERFARSQLASSWQESWIRKGLHALRRNDLKSFLERAESRGLRTEFRRLRVGLVLPHFFDVGTRDEELALVETEPDLLDPVVDDLLEEWIEDHRRAGKDESVRFLQDYKTLFRRCRKIGPQVAFRQYGLPADPERTPEVERLFQELDEFSGRPDLSQSELARAIDLCRRLRAAVHPDRDAYWLANVNGHLGKLLLALGGDCAEALTALANAVREPALLEVSPEQFARFAQAYDDALKDDGDPHYESVLESLKRALNQIDPSEQSAVRDACRDIFASLLALKLIAHAGQAVDGPSDSAPRNPPANRR